MSLSAFGVDHGEISKAEKKKNAITGGVAAAGGGIGAAAVLGATKMPEHQHYSAKARKHINSLPPGVHEVDAKLLHKNPRKLGARKQQRSYVAAMAQERPHHTYSPVPVTRYKDGSVIQRDNAHSVMAHAMKGREKVQIKVEDAPGYRPKRRTGEELVRRAQSKYQGRRLKAHTNLSEGKINSLVGQYKPSSRAANTTKRPHGVVEDTFKYSKTPYGSSVKKPLNLARRAARFAKAGNRRRDTAAGATGAAGLGTLAATPVRRSAPKVNVSGGTMKASDAKKVLNPGYRPGNNKSIRTLAANLGHLENSPTSVIRYKDKSVIPFDGSHRGTARVARGDKNIPVKVVEGGDRPAISVARNAYHSGQQKLHQRRMNSDVFKPKTEGARYTGKHAGESKVHSAIANGSPVRSGKRVDVASSRFARGPSKGVLRTKQGAAVAAGVGLLGTAEHLHRKGKR